MILSGIRVVTFTTGIAGPNAGRILASLGAEVIKIESRKGGVDSFRHFGSSGDLNSSPRFAEANLGVRSLAVNLKDTAGLEVVKALIARSDVVLENYRPDVLDRLGLGFGALQGLKPDIIQVKMPGLGSTGPMKEYGTWGALLNAYTGLTWLWNHPAASAPVGNQGVFPDYLSAVLAPTVLVAALLRRDRTGQGGLIDLAQSEATAYAALPVSMLDVSVNGRDPEAVGNASRDDALQGVYRCKGDDRWVALRADADAQWVALCRTIRRDDLLADPTLADARARRASQPRIDDAIEAWTRDRTPAEAMATLQAAGVAAGTVASGLDLIADPQLNRRAFLRTIDQPRVGPMLVPGLPVVSDPDVLHEPGPAAMLGQDNEYVVRTVIGLPQERYQELVDAQVLA